MNAVETIIRRKQLADPSRAEFFTEDWVRRQCADLNWTPEEYLADQEAIDARIAIGTPTPAPDPKWETMRVEDPENYLMWLDKYSGPVDGYSAELMGCAAFWELPEERQTWLRLALIGAKGADAIQTAYDAVTAIGYKGPEVGEAKRLLGVS